jgi:hypothetical protein
MHMGRIIDLDTWSSKPELGIVLSKYVCLCYIIIPLTFSHCVLLMADAITYFLKPCQTNSITSGQHIEF